MLNTIEVGTLAKAYDLNIYQCIDLVQKVDCWSAKNVKQTASNLAKIEASSRYYAEVLANNPKDAIRMMHGAAIGWREGEAADFIVEEIQRYQEYLYIGFEDGNMIDIGLKNEVLNLLLPIVRIFFISQLAVDKIQAVNLLNENGFSLIQEVRGLTKDSVDKILAPKTVIRSSTPVVIIDNALEPPQQPAVEPTQERNRPDNTQHIQAWESILPELTGAELTAAKLAIEKWYGKSHVEAFEAIRPGEKVQEPKNYVSKKQEKAQTIALRYGLTMPPWNTINEQPTP